MEGGVRGGWVVKKKNMLLLYIYIYKTNYQQYVRANTRRGNKYTNINNIRNMCISSNKIDVVLQHIQVYSHAKPAIVGGGYVNVCQPAQMAISCSDVFSHMFSCDCGGGGVRWGAWG